MGELNGCIMIVVCSLYGLKTSVVCFHAVLFKSLFSIGFSPSKLDTDLWIKDCGTHYEYISTYVDDLLIMAKDPMAIVKELENDFPLKGMGTLEYYLGGDIITHKKPNGEMGLATSSKTYIKKV